MKDELRAPKAELKDEEDGEVHEEDGSFEEELDNASEERDPLA